MASTAWVVTAGLALVASDALAFTLQVDSSGSLVHAWASPKIVFDYNYSDCLSQGVTAEQLDAAVASAFDLWHSVPTAAIRLSRGEAVTKTGAEVRSQATGGNPLILCDSAMNQSIGSGGETANTNNIPSLTQILRVDSGNRIALAVIYVNAVPGQAANVGMLLDRADVLKIVLAHEIGHVIGLGHTDDVNALMYFSASRKSELSLSRDDAQGVSYLYPRDELSGSGIFGCGTLGGGGAGGTGRGAGRGRGEMSPARRATSSALAAELLLLFVVCGCVVRVLRRDYPMLG